MRTTTTNCSVGAMTSARHPPPVIFRLWSWSSPKPPAPTRFSAATAPNSSSATPISPTSSFSECTAYPTPCETSSPKPFFASRCDAAEALLAVLNPHSDQGTRENSLTLLSYEARGLILSENACIWPQRRTLVRLREALQNLKPGPQQASTLQSHQAFSKAGDRARGFAVFP